MTRTALLALLALAALVPAPARAQLTPGPLPIAPRPATIDEPFFQHPPIPGAATYVVIRLAENRIYLLDRGVVRWSAPVGTGTGFRLQGGSAEWHFATPRGLFRVQHKEKDPIWIKPDWAFIENGEPIPPLSSPLRRKQGMLGTSALYIGYELAIHGTDKPELVLHDDPEARRVSHGCIRLTDEDARVLFHAVEIGTPVLIY
jgi:L,D-transpeptidase YbiS